jgi:hypothetical protein
MITIMGGTRYQMMDMDFLTPKILGAFLPNFANFGIVGEFHFSNKKSMRT